MEVGRFSCSSGEREPLTRWGGGGDGGRRDGQRSSERGGCSSRTGSSSGSRGYSMTGIRVPAAAMFTLVLVGLVGIFNSIQNARMPGPAVAASTPAPDETPATVTVDNDESGTFSFLFFVFALVVPRLVGSFERGSLPCIRYEIYKVKYGFPYPTTTCVRVGPSKNRYCFGRLFWHSFDHMLTPDLAPWLLSPNIARLHVLHLFESEMNSSINDRLSKYRHVMRYFDTTVHTNLRKLCTADDADSQCEHSVRHSKTIDIFPTG